MPRIECPNCKQPTVKETKVYPNKDHYAPPTSIEFQANSAKSFYEAVTTWPGLTGDIQFTELEPIRIPIQLVYTCTTCGYTKVYDLTKEEQQ